MHEGGDALSNLQIGVQIVAMFFVLVTLHEWGHFYFAKRAGILVREFAIGFGPKLFSYKKGETRYTLRLLPIGGFVRMAGEDPEIPQIATGQTIAFKLKDNHVSHFFTDKWEQQADVREGMVKNIDLERDLKVQLFANGETVTYLVDPKAVVVSKDRETQIAPWDRQFGSKTVGQRALSIFAGPLMNFLLSFVLFLLFMLLNGVSTNVKLDNVEANSPAYQAGLQAGDLIKEVNFQPIGTDVNKLTTLIKDSQNKPMNWVISRKGEQIQKTVTPVNNLVGIRLTWEKRDATVIEAVSGAWDQLLFSAKQILIGFKMLLFGQFKMEDLGGPIRIVEVSGQFAQAGLAYMVSWSGLLSLYLGLFNLLPIPALDGSRLVFLGIEAIRGKPVDPNRESMVHFIGFAMLMLLMVAVTYNDILRLING